MRLATILDRGADVPVLVDPERGVVPIASLTDRPVPSLLSVIEDDLYDDLVAAAASAGAESFRPSTDVTWTAPYRRPRKIWGIGLNYVDHAADLSESVPDEPASFIKGDHTIIGQGDDIPIPSQSERTTAEGELGLVIGRECRNVSEEEALDHVFGVTTILDQTAEDILQRNPRFLTRSKNFPGFFSFGPEIVPMAEVLERFGSIGDVEVSTVVNGDQARTNTVAHMRYSPAFLVAFHSAVMPLFPGDVISTGTPGAIHVRAGDVAECRIPGIGRLVNPVVSG
ncbi:fumarylacetoacetate hydrolase family protein [Nocardioides sp. zg-1228]|uniref:fumarylacetoacetate hydrolase family protein n=1 Tax=Nocardioides sp. zg-1228 TaxID=2763008 RepID=UPI0016427957|nr:fumarylacetoacetate hydrolase family protein [Nocardioides sp. zg-1228]MBC2931968.1 fumarylacetoacetate hydrolase family protein [Nocardioides sp. zg-1228]QSF57524.1 fumarylacetoacetate hydrolase family protein [Nocardioides sp. zg-1228]